MSEKLLRRAPARRRRGEPTIGAGLSPGDKGNYGRIMGAHGSRTDRAIVAETAALVASRLDNQLEATTRSIQQLLVTEITDLGGDAQLVQLLRDTVASNVDTFFSAIRNGIPIEHIEPPTAALEYARRLAQREVSADALVRAYRLGHRAALDVVLEEIRASELDPKLSLDVYAASARHLSG
jgi:hypothetical protein